MPLPQVIIVSAPSGTGKSTINQRLVGTIEDLSFSVSYTSRQCRPGEADGVNYWFIERQDFAKKIESGDMLEWAEVFGNYYGTPKQEVERIQKEGKRPLLEIDVQGFKIIRPKISDAKSIFMMPPSMQDLWDRLAKRGTDSLEVRQRRFAIARTELELATKFDHFVINDTVEHAFQEMYDHIALDKPFSLSRDEALKHCARLMNEKTTAE